MMSSASDRGMLSKATAAQPRAPPAGGEPGGEGTAPLPGRTACPI